MNYIFNLFKAKKHEYLFTFITQIITPAMRHSFSELKFIFDAAHSFLKYLIKPDWNSWVSSLGNEIFHDLRPI